MNKKATNCLNSFKKINFDKLNERYTKDVLCYEEAFPLYYQKDKVYTKDNKNLKDLLRIIRIKDADNLKYENTNILIPRVYAESLAEIPQHISIQCLFFWKLKKEDLEKLGSLIQSEVYNKTIYDKMWISLEKDLLSLKENDSIYIMSRRVGGWDGSVEKPVIELLCSGGHLPTLWNNEMECFETLEPEELLKKEILEEVGLSIDKKRFMKIGGFHARTTNELVILCALFIDRKELNKMINFARGNISENVDGIYLGEFEDVMKLYELHPEYFAGGKKAKPTNFPENTNLMDKIKILLEDKNENRIRNKDTEHQ